MISENDAQFWQVTCFAVMRACSRAFYECLKGRLTFSLRALSLTSGRHFNSSNWGQWSFPVLSCRCVKTSLSRSFKAYRDKLFLSLSHRREMSLCGWQDVEIKLLSLSLPLSQLVSFPSFSFSVSFSISVFLFFKFVYYSLMQFFHDHFLAEYQDRYILIKLVTTPPPHPAPREPWRVRDAVVGRGNARWTASKSGHPCPCQNCSQGPPAEKTERGSLLPRRPNRSMGLDWTELAKDLTKTDKSFDED